MKTLIEKKVGAAASREGNSRKKEKLQKEVDVFKMLFNPKSFTQV